MDKKQLIQRICRMDKCAKAELLANYPEQELEAYLEHLEQLHESRELIGSSKA